jgi:hypothetical protein
MNLLADAISSLGAVLLPFVAALLLEELTYGGLVRLLIAPWPGSSKRGAPISRSTSLGSKRTEHNHPMGEGK